MSAYDITGFLRTEYRLIAYCVPSEKKLNTAPSLIYCLVRLILQAHTLENLKKKMTPLLMAYRNILILVTNNHYTTVSEKTTAAIFHHGPLHDGLTKRNVNRNYLGISGTRLHGFLLDKFYA